MVSANYLDIAIGLNLLSTAMLGIFLWTQNLFLGRIGIWAGWGGFLATTATLLARWRESYLVGYGHVPLTNLYESILFFAWTIILAFLVTDLKYRQRSIGAVVMPLAFACTFWAQTRLDSSIKPLVPALQSNWLAFHVITCILGYACFAVGAGASILYLLKDRPKGRGEGRVLKALPATELLDEINYWVIMAGFPLLTTGMVSGALWANRAWGTYWSWDPKETWSLIIWLIYATFLHGRLTRGWSGKRTAWLSIAGFAATLFCYLGVNLLLAGLHSYGAG